MRRHFEVLSNRRRRSVQVGVCTALAGVGALIGGVPALAAQDMPLTPGTPCTVTARACVDLASASAWLITDGVVTYGPALIASGAPGAETPTGTTVVD